MVRDLQSYERPADFHKRQIIGQRKGLWFKWPWAIAILMLGLFIGAHLT